MAFFVLQVLVVGVITAAADDVRVQWSSSPRTTLPCSVPDAERVQPRRPPPPLEGSQAPKHPGPYVWWRDGEDITTSRRVLANGTLEVSKRRDGEGLYQCGAQHHWSLVLGLPIQLKFANMEKHFSSHPENSTTRVTQPVLMSCNISSEPPALVSWMKDGNTLPEDDRIYQFQNKLLILNARSEDEGLYRCIATNPYVNKTRISHGGRLVVEGSEDLQPAVLDVMMEHDIVAERGSRVVIPCPVVGWPRPRLVWKLSPPGGRIAELELTEEVLVLNNLQDDQEGVYTCQIEDSSDILKTFNVTVAEPVIITNPPASKEALRASTIRFNCSASGHPTPEIKWYKNGLPLAMTGRIKLLKSSVDGRRRELVISAVVSDDAGVYQCFASNAVSVASSWASLNVTGPGAAAPSRVTCAPLTATSVALRWTPADNVVAYTVHTTPQGKPGRELTGIPHTKNDEVIKLEDALTPYLFQVRAYATNNIKNVASDFSKTAVCEGQGVPIKLMKLEADDVLVSWKEFADHNPGVQEYILQHRLEDHGEEHNITLDGSTHNYTLSAPSSLEVRLLGSRSRTWLHQNLTLVPWTSTKEAILDIGPGKEDLVSVEGLEVTNVGAHGFALTWSSSGPQTSFLVCVKLLTSFNENEECQESYKTTAVVEGLQAGEKYSVRVQAGHLGSDSIQVTTLTDGPQRFKDLSYKFINDTTVLVSWSGPLTNYSVHYSAGLTLPVEEWKTTKADGNTVIINNINSSGQTFVMVTGTDPLVHSQILTIPPQTPAKESPEKKVQYSYVSDGVLVYVGVGGSVLVSQNISRPLEHWARANVTQGEVLLSDLDPSLPTYVMVAGVLSSRPSTVLTIPPAPKTNNSLYIGIGTAVVAMLVCIVCLTAICVWRRRKRARSPLRIRRRNTSGLETSEEEGSEMKNIGGRLANGGGGRDAGEPLLNGHVRITENPTTKTPNGKVKKQRPKYEAAFDVSRFTDPDSTLETVLEDTSTSTNFNLLDASRRPEYDSKSSSANNSFSKLPDGNMNSELTRSADFQRDDSKIQPTLQPNG